MIIDAHAHIFPHLDGPSGYSEGRQRVLMQAHTANHRVMPVRRKRDHTVVTTPTLWDPDKPGIDGRWDVNFRATTMGRLEWNYAGEDYYMQFMPPSLQDNTAPAELLLASMDLAGVDRAVLQFGYGNVNEYFADAIRRYPGKFYGLGGPNEDTPDPAARAEHVAHMVEELGLHGITYRNAFFSGPVPYDEPAHDIFWREVKRLGIPVWWNIRGKDHRKVWGQFARWCDRHPDIPSVIVMAIPYDVMVEKGRPQLPAYVLETVERHHVYLEICYAIIHGAWEEYPFPETNRLIKELYEKVGARRLVWGTDFPNIERFCTYAQALDHVRRHCHFISPADMQLILGGNLAALLGDRIDREVSASRRAP